jgi:transposase
MCPVPQETARRARAADLQDKRCMPLRNVLGSIDTDEDCANLLPREGQSAEAPWRFALATVRPSVENLSDRQAAAAARGRIDGGVARFATNRYGM